MRLHQAMSLLLRPSMGTLKEGMGHSGVVYWELITGKMSELNISNCMSKDFLQNHNKSWQTLLVNRVGSWDDLTGWAHRWDHRVCWLKSFWSDNQADHWSRHMNASHDGFTDRRQAAWVEQSCFTSWWSGRREEMGVWSPHYHPKAHPQGFIPSNKATDPHTTSITAK